MRGTCAFFGLILAVSACFKDSGATTSSDGETTTSDSTVDSSGGGPTSGVDTTTGSGDATVDDTGSAGCGNGRPDPGEACDDGNDVDADGCTRTCELSGSIRWTKVYGGGSGDQRAQGVAYAPDEDAFYVVGYRGLSTTLDEWQLKLTSTGDMIFDITLDDPDRDNRAFGAASAPDGTIVYTGFTEGQNGDIFLRRIGTDGSIIESVSYGGAALEQDRGLDVAVADGGQVLLAGREIDAAMQVRALVLGYQVDFAVAPWIDTVGIAPSTASGAAWSTSIGAFFVVGYEGSPEAGWVRRYAIDGTPAWNNGISADGDFRLIAVTASADTVFACGWETPPSVPYRSRMYAFSAQTGDELWNVSWDGVVDAGAYCQGISVDAQGDLVTAGASLFAGGSDPQPFVRKISAVDGGELWVTLIDEASAPVGWLDAVAIGNDNGIVVVGTAGANAEARVPIVAALAP